MVKFNGFCQAKPSVHNCYTSKKLITGMGGFKPFSCYFINKSWKFKSPHAFKFEPSANGYQNQYMVTTQVQMYIIPNMQWLLQNDKSLPRAVTCSSKMHNPER